MKDRVCTADASKRRSRILGHFERLEEAHCNAFFTPVTPEVAGSSPVAPVENILQIESFVVCVGADDRRLPAGLPH